MIYILFFIYYTSIKHSNQEEGGNLTLLSPVRRTATGLCHLILPTSMCEVGDAFFLSPMKHGGGVEKGWDRLRWPTSHLKSSFSRLEPQAQVLTKYLLSREQSNNPKTQEEESQDLDPPRAQKLEFMTPRRICKSGKSPSAPRAPVGPSLLRD